MELSQYLKKTAKNFKCHQITRCKPSTLLILLPYLFISDAKSEMAPLYLKTSGRFSWKKNKNQVAFKCVNFSKSVYAEDCSTWLINANFVLINSIKIIILENISTIYLIYIISNISKLGTFNFLIFFFVWNFLL